MTVCPSDELDSYMFQTVGHHVIGLYGQALGVPLYRRTIQGRSVQLGADYTINKDDEVEDLYELLKEVKVHSSSLDYINDYGLTPTK